MFPGFILLLAWLVLPPLLIGALVLRRLRGGAQTKLWKQVTVLGVASFVLEFVFLVVGPDDWGRHIGVRDVHAFGLQTMWAPFAWLAVAIAWPPVYFWFKWKGRNAL